MSLMTHFIYPYCPLRRFVQRYKITLSWGLKSFHGPCDSCLYGRLVNACLLINQDPNHSESMRDIAKNISLTLFILTAMIIYSGEGEGEVLVCFIQTCTSPHAVFLKYDKTVFLYIRRKFPSLKQNMLIGNAKPILLTCWFVCFFYAIYKFIDSLIFYAAAIYHVTFGW